MAIVAGMDDLPAECGGPKMQALANDRMRKFAYIMACGEESGAEAARMAGYPDESGSAKVTAHRLMHDARILDAIEEATRNILRGLAPLAVRRAYGILENTDHPAHARMIETVLDRTGHFAKTEHTMRVEHTVDTRELEVLALRLAKETGVSAEKFLGGESPKLIEGEVVSRGTED